MFRAASFCVASTFVLFLTSATLHAQYNTPAVDGVIESGEYGNTANGTNQINTSTGQTWYMTWDATNLYVGITNANISEAAVIYIDANPITPPNGGTNSNGNLTGFNYDGEEVSTLPFRAQFVTYVKDGYREYRTSNGSGGWSGSTSNYGSFADNGGTNTREVAIPWSGITGGGIPSSFLFLGLLTSSGGYVYGQVPTDNGGGPIGTSATYTQYYQVNSTANGASTPPFSAEASSSAVSFTGLYHNTFDPYYRSQEGAVSAGSTVTLRFRTAHLGASSVNMRVYLFDTASGNTTGPLDNAMSFYQTTTVSGTLYDVYTIDYTTPSTPTVVYYKFEAVNGTGSAWYSDDYIDDYDNLNKDGTGVASSTEPFNSFQITAYDPAFTTPTWTTNANIYQIFPDRFRNGDTTNDYCVTGSTTGCPSFYGAGGSANIAVTTWNTLLCDPNNSSGSCYQNFGSIFYGGDLLGIQNELDYIQGLGFDTLYLNPIFQGSSNHRYDTDDFMNVDPALGGNAALASLTQQLSERGMSLIVDGTLEDASSDSLYFNEYNRFSTTGACQSLSSTWRTWFQFSDSNIPCTPADYTGWSGYSSLPLMDTTQTAVQNFFYSGSNSLIQYWYGLGASGWRFDSAPAIPQSFWHALRPYAKGYNANGPLIGEIWPNASAWLAGDQMDSTMNYRFRRNVNGFVIWPNTWSDDNDNGSDAIIPLTPSQFDTASRAVRDDYPPQATAAMMNLIDSHDTNRALYVMTETGDSGLTQAKQRLELAALIQFTYLGAPTVFYGDEIAINAPSRYSGSTGPEGDPYTRAPYPWTDQAGDPTVYGPPDAGVQAYYTNLGHIRKQHASLRNGTFATLLTGDTQQPTTAANTYAYARSNGSETAIVALNNSSASNAPAIPVGAYYPDGTTLQDVISGATYSVSGGNVSLTLAGYTGVLLLPNPATVDLTPPTATISLSPAPNGNGWINSLPVTATITGMDSGSGVGTVITWVDGGTPVSTSGTSASASITSAGSHTVSARVLDNAGNISTQYNQSVNVDVTAPVSSASASAAPNGAGWYNAPVTISISATDSGSGVAQIQYSLSGAQTGSATVSGSSASVVISANGSTTLTYFSVDNAGNTEGSHTLTVNVDATLPVIVPSVVGTMGANGWYISAVTVTWSVTDSYSGIASSMGCNPATVTGYTPSSTISCSAVSVAGLPNAVAVTLKIDPARVQTLNATATDTFVAAASASLSANGQIVVNSSSSTALAVRAHATVTATAVDVAGGFTKAPTGSISPAPVTGAGSRPDPLASLAAPTFSGCAHTNFTLHSGTHAVTPGVYCGGITITGGTVTFGAGLYVIQGGGLSISGGTATGSGVTFYVTGNGAHAYGPVAITAAAQVNFTAPASGSLSGMLIFQAHSIAASMPASSIVGNSSMQLNGTLYFPTTKLEYDGGGSTAGGPTVIVAAKATFSGSTTLQ